jgi:PAS domain S-box-containing protein
MKKQVPMLVYGVGILFAGGLVLTSLVVGPQIFTLSTALSGLLLVACAALFVSLLRLRHGLRPLSMRAAESCAALQLSTPPDPLQAIERSLRGLSDALTATRAQISEQSARREHAEVELQHTQERYALAVRGADDGMWEWNLRGGQTHFSPRWKSMLGYADDELGERIEEWHQRIHPEDRDRVLAELDAHLAGKLPRFENEHRIRHRDGEYRWILARGAAVRNAAGQAYRMVGLHTDISPRKRVQEALIEVAEGLSTLSGEQGLRELTRRFAGVLGVREAFICECSDFPTTRVRMVARWNNGEFAPCKEFDLAGTPCEAVITTGNSLCVTDNVGVRWPRELPFDRESYLGLPCIDTQGRVIGHIACMDGKEMRQELPHLAILKIFAIRAAVELERRQLERERHGMLATLPADLGTPATLH